MLGRRGYRAHSALKRLPELLKATSGCVFKLISTSSSSRRYSDGRGELARWNIETTIIVPGAFTSGTNHFAHAGSHADTQRVAEYEAGPYKGFADDIMKGFTSIVPPEADVSAVAEAIVKVVDTPFGKRPFRVHVDPAQDCSGRRNSSAGRS